MHIRNPKRFLLLAAAALSVGATGCVLPDHIGQIQKEIAGVQTRIQNLENDQEQAIQRLESLARDMENNEESVSRSDFADLKLEIQDNTRKLAILEEQFRETNSRLDDQSRDLQEALTLLRVPGSGPAPALPAESGAPAETPPVSENPFRAAQQPVPDAEGLYNAAYADFSKGNYGLAISGFQEYIQKFAGSDLADNAMFWIGECHYSEGRFQEAIDAFDNLLDQYPDSDRVVSANVKKGLAYLEMNDIKKAVVQLQYVQEKYPDADEARIARDTLASLGVPVH